MLAPLIPWPVFFQAMRRQKSRLVQAWQRYWIFSDYGAALIPRPGEETTEPSLSLYEKQKIAALFAATRGTRAKIPSLIKAKLDATGIRTQGRHTLIAIFLLTFLFVLLISLRKELTSDAPLRGIAHLGLAVSGVCTFIALMAAYFEARKVIVPESISLRIDTAIVSQLAGTT